MNKQELKKTVKPIIDHGDAIRAAIDEATFAAAAHIACIQQKFEDIERSIKQLKKEVDHLKKKK